MSLIESETAPPAEQVAGLLPEDLEGEERAPAFLADPFADEGEDQVTADAALAMGFSEEDLEVLWQVGVLVREEQVGRWEPETLADVDWIIEQRKVVRFKLAERERVHQEAIARFKRAETALSRWDDLCLQITDANLDRDRTGKPRAKSIPLENGIVRIKSFKGGPKVENEAAVLAYILEQEEPPASLLAALRVSVTESYEGLGALAVLTDDAYAELRKPKVLHKPVQEFVAALPSVPGEALPQTIPGVVLVPPSDEWSFD